MFSTSLLSHLYIENNFNVSKSRYALKTTHIILWKIINNFKNIREFLKLCEGLIYILYARRARAFFVIIISFP